MIHTKPRCLFFFLSVACLLAVLNARLALAGAHVRNGGYGVVEDGMLYSLDLYAKSLHVGDSDLDASASDGGYSILVKPLVQAVVRNDASAVDAVSREVSLRLARMEGLFAALKLDYPLRAAVLNAASYKWVFHDIKCLDIRDDATYPHMIQLAYRQAGWIRFCRDSRKLDVRNMAALVIHEIIYAAQTEKSETKEFVASMFDEDLFQSLEPKDLRYLQLSTVVDSLRETLTLPLWFFHTSMKNKVPLPGFYAEDEGAVSIQVREFTCTEAGCDLFVDLDPFATGSKSVATRFTCNRQGVCQLQDGIPGISPSLAMRPNRAVEFYRNGRSTILQSEL